MGKKRLLVIVDVVKYEIEILAVSRAIVRVALIMDRLVRNGTFSKSLRGKTGKLRQQQVKRELQNCTIC